MPTISDITVTPLGPLEGPHHLRVSSNRDGTQNGNALGGDISADGRFVVFISTSSNMVAGDTNGTADIFRKDLLTGVVELVSCTAAGVIGDGISGLAAGPTGVGASNWSMPTISENGRYVGFVSAAQNLPGAVAGVISGYVKDMALGTVFNLSQPLGISIGQPSPSISTVSMGADGRARVQLENVPLGTPEFWQLNVAPGYAYTVGPLPLNPGLPQFFGNYGHGRPAPTLGGAIGVVAGWDVPTAHLLSWTLDNIPALGDSNGLGDVILTGPAGARVISRQLSGPGGGPPAESDQVSYPGFLSIDGRVATFFTDATNIDAGAAAAGGGGVIVTAPSTVWAYVAPSDAAIAARDDAIADNRTAALSFGLTDATRFRASWGDGTVITGSTGDANQLRLEKTYAANGSYFVSVRLDGPGGMVIESTRLHLLDRATAQTLIGTNHRDIVFAGDQSDQIETRNGNDVIHAGAGNDTIIAGAGADTVFGGAGDDTFVDGRGLSFPDHYIGGLGINRVTYATTREAMQIYLDGEPLAHGAAVAGRATVLTPGGPVTDRLYDIQNVNGGDGENLIFGSEADNVIIGGRRGDYIEGKGGDDSLVGLAGNDVLRSGTGNDTLDGGEGNDLLILTAGQSVARGGAGANALFFDYDGSVDDNAVWVVDLSAGTATRAADGALITLSGTFEEIGGHRGLEVHGTAARETFLLSSYASVFHGNGGVDTLSARTITNGVLIDASTAIGTAELVWGGREGGGPTQFTGIRILEGGDGDDTLIGSTAGNRLAGGLGNDVLEALGGADRLEGGWGADAFVLGLYATPDLIADFASGTDQLWLYAADFGLAAGGLDPALLTFGAVAVGAQAQFVFDGATRLLSWDADGEGAQAATHLALLQPGATLAVGDFLII